MGGWDQPAGLLPRSWLQRAGHRSVAVPPMPFPHLPIVLRSLHLPPRSRVSALRHPALKEGVMAAIAACQASGVPNQRLRANHYSVRGRSIPKGRHRCRVHGQTRCQALRLTLRRRGCRDGSSATGVLCGAVACRAIRSAERTNCRSKRVALRADQRYFWQLKKATMCACMIVLSRG